MNFRKDYLVIWDKRVKRASTLTSSLTQIGTSFECKDCLVSVIIPVYNQTDMLSRAVKSLLDWTYGNLETVVVDDGSTEDIKGVLDIFDDDRIHYIRHEANGGVAATRNTGIRFAHEEHVAFLDSDDEWFERKIERQLSDLIKR
jgi:glycosyltransferase involved in cell wall biosynthesis